MMRLVVCLLAGLHGTVAQPTSKCIGDATCGAHLAEDMAAIQMPRTGAKTGQPWHTFALNSRPYLGSRRGSLGEGEQGALQINEDGVINTYYLPGASIVDEGMTVKYEPPYRYYLMKIPTTNYSNADDFYKPIFLGKTFTVDIDFRKDGPSCGCNLNFYLVDMPVDFEGDDHDYYCDAQCFVGKGCCFEFDMNEGNMNVQQVTNHACTGDYGDHPDWACHKWGEPEVKTHGTDFGVGPDYQIDSTKPFTFSQRFDVEEGSFVFTTTISQEGREIVKTMGPGSDQLDAMLEKLEQGLAFVTGYWHAPDMNWMDGETCGHGPEHCNMNPAYISNWRITSNNSPMPVPASPEPLSVPASESQ